MDRNARAALHQRRRQISKRGESTDGSQRLGGAARRRWPAKLQRAYRGYCRVRLPLEMARGLVRQTGRMLSHKAHPQWLWRGRAVKLVDGTGLSMPDTPENQAVYPQPSTQAAGVGFPLARLVVVICLATGAALDASIGPHQGKGTGENDLVRQVLQALRPGDVVLADALYCNYFLISRADGCGCGRVV